MKKIINKNSLLAFLIGGILFSGINVCADYLYKSQQISYNESNIKESLDELYTKTSIISNGDATANDIVLGKTAVVNGKLVTGTAELGRKTLTKVLLGASTGTYDLKAYEDYKQFTNDNFAVEIVNATGSIWYSGRADCGSNGSGSLNFSKNYNSSTGSLSVSSSGNTGLYVTEFGKANSDATFGANIKVYLYYVK